MLFINVATNHFKNDLCLKKDIAVKTLTITLTGHAPHPLVLHDKYGAG